jgi:hypothetical protein
MGTLLMSQQHFNRHKALSKRQQEVCKIVDGRIVAKRIWNRRSIQITKLQKYSYMLFTKETQTPKPNM